MSVNGNKIMMEQPMARGGQELKKILIVTAVAAERDAVLRGLGEDNKFNVVAAGVGPVAAAVATAKALAAAEYDLVISAGIGGGFAGQAEVGSIVVADRIIAADLGAQTDEGFLSMDELGFGFTHIQADPELSGRLVNALRNAGITVSTGAVLTLSTVTGTAATAAELSGRVPGAAAEAMEGFGVAFAATDRGLPIMEIRSISNRVGPRDRTAWRIEEALEALARASCIMKEMIPTT